MVAGFDFALLAKALSRVLEDLCPVGFLRGMSHRLAVLRSVRLTGLGDPQFDVDCPTPVACESQVFEHERKQHFRATLPFAAAFSGTESAPTLKGMRKKGPFLVQLLGHFLADERLIPGAPALELLLFPGVLLLQSLQLLPQGLENWLQRGSLLRRVAVHIEARVDSVGTGSRSLARALALQTGA